MAAGGGISPARGFEDGGEGGEVGERGERGIGLLGVGVWGMARDGAGENGLRDGKR